VSLRRHRCQQGCSDDHSVIMIGVGLLRARTAPADRRRLVNLRGPAGEALSRIVAELWSTLPRRTAQ
jgi:hypothetical protein